MFKAPMKQVLAEKYGKQYAAEIMKKSHKVYKKLVAQADDIGDGNPMAYNELFALAFVAPYVASEKKIPPETSGVSLGSIIISALPGFGSTVGAGAGSAAPQPMRSISESAVMNAESFFKAMPPEC